MTGGGPIVDGPLSSGAFYRPSMLETDALDVPLVQEEVFGPVLSFARGLRAMEEFQEIKTQIRVAAPAAFEADMSNIRFARPSVLAR